MTTSSSDSLRPRPGDVIQYGFLFSDQAGRGREDAVKDRPCVVVLSVGEGDRPRVMVSPVTSQPSADPAAIALSAGALGLDRPSWILPWEINVFIWPGPDLARAKSPAGAWWRYGRLAPELRNLLADRVAAALTARKARLVQRTE